MFDLTLFNFEIISEQTQIFGGRVCNSSTGGLYFGGASRIHGAFRQRRFQDGHQTDPQKLPSAQAIHRHR